MTMIENKATELLSAEDFNSAFADSDILRLEELAKSCGIPRHFQHMDMSPWTVSLLDTCKDYPRRNWQHLVDHGFWGSMMDLKSPDFTIFRELDEFIILFGQVVAKARVASRM